MDSGSKSRLPDGLPISNDRVSTRYTAEEIVHILAAETLRRHELRHGYSAIGTWSAVESEGGIISVIDVNIEVGLHPVEGVHETGE